jgi:hypothetical protein
LASKWWKGGAGNKTDADRKPPLSVIRQRCTGGPIW